MKALTHLLIRLICLSIGLAPAAGAQAFASVSVAPAMVQHQQGHRLAAQSGCHKAEMSLKGEAGSGAQQHKCCPDQKSCSSSCVAKCVTVFGIVSGSARVLDLGPSKPAPTEPVLARSRSIGPAPPPPRA